MLLRNKKLELQKLPRGSPERLVNRAGIDVSCASTGYEGTLKADPSICVSASASTTMKFTSVATLAFLAASASAFAPAFAPRKALAPALERYGD